MQSKLEQATRIILEVTSTEIKKMVASKEIWIYDGYIGPVHFSYPRFTQSRGLKQIGGRISNTSLFTEWEGPTNSHLYELVGSIGKKALVYYYLLCLEDGREFFLRQDFKSLSIINDLPNSVFKKIMISIFSEIQGKKFSRIITERINKRSR